MRTAQAWFTGGPSGGGGGEPQKPSSSSLLADWNSYAASRSTEEGGASAFGFDIESAVQSANDEVTGTFSVFCWSEKGTSSFLLALANAFGSADNLVATSLDSYDDLLRKYCKAKSNLKSLRKMGATALHGVDATTMKSHGDLTTRRFDRIVFHFPHAGFRGQEFETPMIHYIGSW